MELVTVKELYRKTDSYLDKEVSIGGWVRSIRDSKAFGFIVVNDGSFFEPISGGIPRYDGRTSKRSPD